MAKFLVVFLFFAFTQAQAATVSGAQGLWDGFGQWSFDGSGVDCSMKMQFSESETEFKRVGGYFDCNIVALSSAESTWTRQGDQLIADGKVVGQIQPNFVQFTENYNEQTDILTTLKINGHDLDYHEVWYENGDVNQVLYDISGHLQLK